MTVARECTSQSEWFTATNPDVLLNVVWVRPLAYSGIIASASLPPSLARRLRLYGCACAQMVWEVLSIDTRNAVLLSERFANYQATQADLHASTVRMMYGPVTYQQQAVNAAGWASAGYWGPTHAPGENYLWNPAEAAREAAKALAIRAAGAAPPSGSPVMREWETTYNTALTAARAHQADLLRNIFPPPDHLPRALRLDRGWLTSTVLTFARQADETGDYSALPILADALQDAGCDNEFMLDRCRAESVLHSRGNWVVDLLLARE